MFGVSDEKYRVSNDDAISSQTPSNELTGLRC